MKIKYPIISLLSALFTIFLVSCGSDTSTTDGVESMESLNSEASVETDSKNIATCMWEDLSVRETPDDKGKYLTAIYLGEMVESLLETRVDENSSKKNEYIKVRLSDGTEGWVRSDLMANNVERYAVLNNTKLHKRPDILAATDDSFYRLDFVVVIEAQNDWYKVKGKPKGESWFKEGWVKASDLSDVDEDINVAVLAKRAWGLKEEDKQNAALSAIIENDALASSSLINDVKNRMVPKPKQYASGNFAAVYEGLVMNMDQYFEEGKDAFMVGDKKLSMMTDGINAIFYFHNLFKSIDSKTGMGNRSTWDQKYEIVTDLSGISPVVRKQDEGAKFDYINTEFVKWASNNMIPDPDSKISGVKMTTIYEQVYSYFFRMMARGYYCATTKMDIANEAAFYSNAMNDDDFYGPQYLKNKYQYAFVDIADGQDYPVFNDPISNDYVIGFWLRRQLDGSIDEVWTGLRMGMMIYDKEWLQQEANRWN